MHFYKKKYILNKMSRFKKVASKIMDRKHVLAKYDVPLPFRVVPSQFKKIVENCNEISDWWKDIKPIIFDNDECNIECRIEKIKSLAIEAKIEFIASGNYGAVFVGCKGGDCNYIVKVQEANEFFEREVFAFYDLNDWEYSPKIYAAWTCGGVGFMVLERVQPLDECMSQGYFQTLPELESQLNFILNELKARKWVYVDLHKGNLMCKNGHLMLVDFGWAVKFPANKKGSVYVDLNHPILLGEFVYDLQNGEYLSLTFENIFEIQEGLKENLLDDLLSEYMARDTSVATFNFRSKITAKTKPKTKPKTNQKKLKAKIFDIEKTRFSFNL